jgi:hypothetical protein
VAWGELRLETSTDLKRFFPLRTWEDVVAVEASGLAGRFQESAWSCAVAEKRFTRPASYSAATAVVYVRSLAVFTAHRCHTWFGGRIIVTIQTRLLCRGAGGLQADVQTRSRSPKSSSSWTAIHRR